METTTIQRDCFRPGEVWLDTDGSPINAHGGGILFHEGTYFWYGEHKGTPTYFDGEWDRVDVIGVSCYSSADLLNWRNHGIVLGAVADDPSHDLHPSKVVERPKVAFCKATGKFVMWVHIDNSNYTLARAGVAVSDSPIGPFEYLGSVMPEGEDSRDQTLFVDDDGLAYRIYSSEGNATTYISLLSPDFTSHTGRFVRAFVGRHMEAQAIFKHGRKYCLIASGCSGWDPNEARSAVADSIWGPWTELGNPCVGPRAELTFDAQSTFVVPVAGQEAMFVFMADRWNRCDLQDSRYVWLPIEFDDGRPVIRWRDEWELPGVMS